MAYLRMPNWCHLMSLLRMRNHFLIARYTKCAHVHTSLHEQSQLNGHNLCSIRWQFRWQPWVLPMEILEGWGCTRDMWLFWPGRRTSLLNPIWMIQTDHLKPIGMGWNMLKPKVHKVHFGSVLTNPWPGEVVPTSRLYGSLLWYRGAADPTWEIFQPPCFITEDTIAGWYGMMTIRGNWRFQCRFFVTHSLGLWIVFFLTDLGSWHQDNWNGGLNLKGAVCADLTRCFCHVRLKRLMPLCRPHFLTSHGPPEEWRYFWYLREFLTIPLWCGRLSETKLHNEHQRYHGHHRQAVTCPLRSAGPGNWDWKASPCWSFHGFHFQMISATKHMTGDPCSSITSSDPTWLASPVF